MTRYKLTTALSLIYLLSACHFTPMNEPINNTSASALMTSDSMRPAVLRKSSAAATTQLNQAISQALHGSQFTMAADAFTRSHQLTLQRSTQDPVNMPGLNGRIMEMPVIHRFSLMSLDGACYLRYEKTGKTYPLQGIRCRTL